MKTRLQMVIVTLIIGCVSLALGQGEKGQNFVLPRITAEAGDGSKVKLNLKAGNSAKGEIYDMPGLSYAKGTFTQEAPDGVKTLVVTGTTAIIRVKHETLGKIPLNIGGEFLVDDMLKMTADGDWDGKKEGAVHTIIGKLTMLDYDFQSDQANPLVFKVTKNGYVYVEGKGTVTDRMNGEKYTLPK